jgi:hypothetical protein
MCDCRRDRKNYSPASKVPVFTRKRSTQNHDAAEYKKQTVLIADLALESCKEVSGSQSIPEKFPTRGTIADSSD